MFKFISHLIYSLSCSIFLFSTEYQIDVSAEVINGYRVKSNSSGCAFSFFLNDRGEVAWSKKLHSPCFFWSKETGTIEMSIEDELRRLGFKEKTNPHEHHPIFIDNYGNVFIAIYFSTSDLGVSPYQGATSERKIGMWNKKNGFALLNIPNIDHVFRCEMSNGLIFVDGRNRDGDENLVVLSPTDSHWPWEEHQEKSTAETTVQVKETTPWDDLYFGKKSARLHILKQLLKNTKDATEKKTVLLMIQAEAGHLMDVLQYDLKCAQASIDKAKKNGKRNLEAEKAHTETERKLKSLQGNMKSLSRAHNFKVTEFDLPSSKWIPKQR